VSTCQHCYGACDQCSEIRCYSCTRNCEACDRTICSACQSVCAQCSKVVCESCQRSERCEVCANDQIEEKTHSTAAT
jgi:hypothetical protein